MEKDVSLVHRTKNKRATSKQTDEQAQWARKHEQSTSKQNLPLKDHQAWTLEQVSESPDQESGLR